MRRKNKERILRVKVKPTNHSSAVLVTVDVRWDYFGGARQGWLMNARQKEHPLQQLEDPQPPHIKEEEEEVWITQEEECLLGQEEADLTQFPLTVVSVKTEEHEDKPPEFSQLHHSPTAVKEAATTFFAPPWLPSETLAVTAALRLSDLQQPLHIKEEEEDPQPPHIKEEEEGECLLGQEEADLSKFPLTVVSVKTEEHEDKPAESSQLHHSPNVCQEQLLPEKPECSSRMAKKDPSKKKTRRHRPCDVSFSSSTQTLPCKKEEEDSLTPHIKEEAMEHLIRQEGDHLEGLVEFPVTGVPVKSEDYEVQGESEERGGGEPPSSSSTQHMTTEADGDHCGGSQADKLLAPLSDSEDTTSHSPDTDDEDSKDDKTCHTDNTHFTCSHCDKTFKYNCHLKVHMRTHTGEKPFICSLCGKGFVESHTLKVHIRTHTGEKPFSCSICGKCFAQNSCLVKHRKIHTGEKSSICSICGKGFVQSNNLKVHMRIHTGEKPFICSICSKGFAESRFLKEHLRTHTGEKPFFCSICGLSFTRKEHLKVHMRTHTGEKPFSCSTCGKGFTQSRCLKRHKRTHTGEKSHSCSMCNRSFCDQSNLIRHMRRHTGEKALSCSVCGERFSYKYQCKKHKCAGENSSSK
ncbi:oocyte zinc finger protein XlCOF22-like isoform X4 [Nerophis ophidion]|uniref:oocyte zinc finger protein XlCOF22-like isoform X4 n=1 Tax=Nerophis ophidion TaxID=159077 RepID=UPI002ADFE477|nr:oocyte zinc finger protein XlCOF22-like isoform X4 [Nerophis ophidion]